MREDALLGIRDRIERVLVKGAERTPAQRAGLETRLSASSLRPAGMPPSAILLIDELADPLPGRLAAGGGLRCDPGWQQALEQRLTALYQRAVRPRAGTLPAGAQAVLFRDRGELIACWTLAGLRGQTSTWWWRLLRLPAGGAGASPAYAALSPDPRWLPAAAARLADWGALLEVAAALERGEAAQLERGLRAAYRLPAPPAASPQGAADAPAIRSASMPHTPPTRRRAPDTPTGPSSRGPWAPWLPAPACIRLHAEQEALFGLALILFHAPERARAPGFETRRAERLAVRRSRRPAPQAGTEPAAFPVTATSPLGAGDAFAAGGTPVTADARAGGEAAPSPTGAPAFAREEPRAGQPAASPASELRSAAGGEAASTGEAGRVWEGDAPRTSPPLDDDSQPAPADSLLEARLPTRIGGVLYLVHLLVELDLPAVFEADWRLASAVGGWGTLDLVARGLLAADPQRARSPRNGAPRSDTFCDRHDRHDDLGEDDLWDDPIWAVLADLDGRRLDQPPGGAYRCDARFVAPASWGSRPPRSGLPPDASIPGPRHQGPPADDLDRWLRAALPWLEHRLSQALDATQGDELLTRGLGALLAARGWLTASATHVDLVLPLDQARVALRRAGLDRTPGWVAHLGRVVSFHFE